MFLLWHVHTFDDQEDDVKLIGVYSDQEHAQEANKRCLHLPGFRDTPDGFVVDKYSLDVDHWTTGYVTMTTIIEDKP